jgi:hypothetical protein
MKNAFAVLVASALVGAAGAAAAQAPSPAQPSASPQPTDGPATPAARLKLRLDELDPTSRATVLAGPRDAAAGPGSALPSLGGEPSRSFDRPPGPKSDSVSSPYPKDTQVR